MSMLITCLPSCIPLGLKTAQLKPPKSQDFISQVHLSVHPRDCITEALGAAPQDTSEITRVLPSAGVCKMNLLSWDEICPLELGCSRLQHLCFTGAPGTTEDTGTRLGSEAAKQGTCNMDPVATNQFINTQRVHCT